MQFTNLDQCLHAVMVIGKCTKIFRGIFFPVRKGIEGRGLSGRIFPWGYLSREEKISMKGVQDFLILFKTKDNEKINIKKFFF